MAAQVLSGSAACSHVTAAFVAVVDVEVEEDVAVGVGFPDQVDRKSMQP